MWQRAVLHQGRPSVLSRYISISPSELGFNPTISTITPAAENGYIINYNFPQTRSSQGRKCIPGDQLLKCHPRTVRCQLTSLHGIYRSTMLICILHVWRSSGLSDICPRMLGSAIFIHIRRQYVSFSILINQTSVAEWLIVASINHKNSNQKCPTNLSLQVALWQQSVIYMKCV
jgi:hypothetical protein